MTVLHTPRKRARHAVVLRPAWVLPGATTDFDFANGRFFGAASMFRSNLLTCTRSSTADYIDFQNGHYQLVPAATPRVSDKGLLIEPAATNVVIRCRDLTQAAWVAVNMTTALDQTGIDGAANSASSITATAGNATILQTDVLGSSSRRASAFVKRITGSGVVNMTTDGGSTWVAVTVTDTLNWTRVNIPAQTVVNPITGFQIVTNGDKIAVDFVQNEVGPIPTSPILTAAASVTRSLDVVKFGFLPQFVNPLYGTLYAEFMLPFLNASVTQTIVAIDLLSGSSSGRIHLSVNTAGNGNFAVVDGGVTQCSISLGAIVAGVNTQVAGAYAANDFNAAGKGFVGTTDTSGTVPTVTQFHFGDNVGTSPTGGYIRRVAYVPQRLPDNVLKQITRPFGVGSA